MNSKLYYFDIEVKAGDNCKLSPNVKGAVVNCYTFEQSMKKASKKILKALIDDNYVIVRVNNSFETNIDELKETEQLNDDELDDFIDSNDVYYGRFYGWEKE